MADQHSTPVRVLVFGASLRKESYNVKLAELAAASVKRAGGVADLAEMREFELPWYDQDVEQASGVPSGADALCRRLKAADAFIIASPEYNSSVPGVLKNAIDWVSR